MNRNSLIVCIIVISTCFEAIGQTDEKIKIAIEIESSLKEELLDVWYPASIDKKFGGFLSSFSYNFKPEDNQNKMIVTQSRHIWVNSKASIEFRDEGYLKNADHGFEFLKNVMWDKAYGGFHTLVTRKGTVISLPEEEKTAYGNAFAIYALAAYYQASGNEEAIDIAKKTFFWLEKFSHDSIHKGYYQHMYKNGSKVIRDKNIHASTEYGFKDQNSSIHLLEAFTELYKVWPDELLRKRITELLLLIRDKIVTPKGYMILFFRPDWQPFSLRDSSRSYIAKTSYLDHVSFGHDVEIAYLMIETSHALGFEFDTTTLKIAKKLVDHSLKNGWDETVGGFFDDGYYFKGEDTLTVTISTKNWWAQAEGLNSLLLMSELFPDDPMNYFEKFKKQWSYINQYLIDHKNGDWYPGGSDRDPLVKTASKGSIWKACYHQYRAMTNSIHMLRKED